MHAYMTGWRIGQILAIKWADLDLEAGTVLSQVLDRVPLLARQSTRCQQLMRRRESCSRSSMSLRALAVGMPASTKIVGARFPNSRP